MLADWPCRPIPATDVLGRSEADGPDAQGYGSTVEVHGEC
jgi:hypothetical protein